MEGAALTRRGLLVGIGAAGGAGAMYAAMGALGLAPGDQDKAFVPPRASDFSLQGRAAGKVVSAPAPSANQRRFLTRMASQFKPDPTTGGLCLLPVY